ncbi:FHA domain-containing protein [Gammaproteobacteria bacterium]|nr:FHA domain-containing protein [Gammaproteobacteria bacterium]
MNSFFSRFWVFALLSGFSMASLSANDFSEEAASERVVLMQVKGIVGRAKDINAVVLTSNLMIAPIRSLSGLSLDLKLAGREAVVVNTYEDQELALVSFPAGGLNPVVIAKTSSDAGRIAHVVTHKGSAASGTVVDLTGSTQNYFGMSMSKALLPLNGAGVFNNCGELIGVYDEDAKSRVAYAIGLASITKIAEGISGTNFSTTECPSEAEKRASIEEKRVRETEDAEAKTAEELRMRDAEAQKSKEEADEAVRKAREEVLAQEEATKKAVGVAEKSAQELAKVEQALDLARKEAAEKEAAAELASEEIKAAADEERSAFEKQLKATREEAVAAAKKREDDTRRAILIGGLVIAVGLMAFSIFYLVRLRRRNNLAFEENEADAASEELAFDVIIRGEGVGIKMQAELIARARGVVIGRSAADCDFVIDSPEVSRAHLRLSEKDEILYVEDLGSANGTILNGLKIQPAQVVALHDGDELELALSKFSVTFQKR